MSRKKVERNIYYDDKRNKYYVTFEYGKNLATGERYREKKTFDTIKAARQALRKHETARDSGHVIIPQDITLGEWLQEWMDTVVSVSRAETTVYAYNQMIKNHIIPDIGEIALQKVTPAILQRYYANLIKMKKLSSNTVKKHHNLLHLAFKTAQRQGMIINNPVDLVEPPKTVKPEINYYNLEQLQDLFAKVEGHRLEIVVKLAGYLGLRREEILGLRWSAIDWEKKIISITEVRTSAGTEIIIKETKTTSSNRKLFIPEELEAILRKEQSKQEEQKEFFGNLYDTGNYVIVNEMGKPIRPNYVSELFKAFIEENGLPPITLHGLRHSFASIANAKGITLYDIGKALGHSTPSTTGKIYTHLLDQNHQELLKKMWG